jgi:hypothetical protein
LAGVLLFDDLGANSAAVDDHLAAVDRRPRREWERIGDIEGPVGGLMEDLVDLRCVFITSTCFWGLLVRGVANLADSFELAR